MHEFAGNPIVGMIADQISTWAGHSTNIVAQMCDNFILIIKQGDARLKFGNYEQVLPSIGIGWQAKAWDRLLILAIHAEVLQGIVYAIAYNDGGFAARALIDP